MKILQVVTFFSLHHGGGTVDVVYKLSRALSQRGHEVTIYTSDFELDREYIDSLRGVEVYPFHSWLNLPELYFCLTPSMVWETKRKLRDFDIVHLHGFRSLQNMIMWHYATEYDIPYIIQAHGSLTTFFQKRRLKKIFDRLWGYRILKDTSKVIAVTTTEAEQYKSMGVSEEKIEIIPNGIDLSEFENLPERGEFRKRWGIDDSQKIILYLARIHEIKGLDLLAKAFDDVSKEIDNVKLVIAGPDDGYLPSLKKLVADLEMGDKVLFTGPLYGQEKLQAYVDADVYVLPSIYEIFGITVLEALACGTPVVVTDRCGISDVIAGQAGLVVTYDKEQLSNAILHMLNNDKMRQQFGEKGRLLIRERFNWEKIAGQVEWLYSDIANKRF